MDHGRNHLVGLGERVLGVDARREEAVAVDHEDAVDVAAEGGDVVVGGVERTTSKETLPNSAASRRRTLIPDSVSSTRAGRMLFQNINALVYFHWLDFNQIPVYAIRTDGGNL